MSVDFLAPEGKRKCRAPFSGRVQGCDGLGNTSRTRPSNPVNPKRQRGFRFPSLALFRCCAVFHSPRSGRTRQPRAAPGEAVAKPSAEPCKGDTSPVGCCAPLGLLPSFFAVFRVPRASPWAVLSGPFGAKTTDTATSKLALRVRVIAGRSSRGVSQTGARLNYAKKWRKLADFRGAKAPFRDAWSRGL
jgi:hypothetical protein